MASLEHYIAREIGKPLLVVAGILTGLFACFSTARYLAEAVTETLGADTMLRLVFLKTVIALEVLLPISLYVAVVIGLGRLYRDQEIIAMQAAGIGGAKVVVAVLLLSVPVGVLVGALSMAGRPWAWEASYVLDARAHSEFNAERFQPGRFYGNEDSGRVVYLRGKSPDGERMEDVFIYRRQGANSEIITARAARQAPLRAQRRGRLHLHDGKLYRLVRTGAGDEVVDFQSLVIYLDPPEDEVGYKRKSASTGALFGSDLPKEVAELQWRLSRPFATVLLALIAIPLSRSTPRGGKHERTVVAALAFAVYYNVSGLAQTWVEQGVVGAFPGVWWLHALLFTAVIVILAPEFRRRDRTAG